MATNGNGDVNISIKAVDDTAQAVRSVTDQLRNLTQTLEAQAKASLSGAAGTAEFRKSLDDVQKTVQTLIAQKAALQDFGIKEDKLSSLKAALDELKRAREFMVSGLPSEQKDWTADQRKGVNALQSEINKAERAVRSASLQYERSEAQLAKMGVTMGNMASTQARLTEAIIEGSNALQAAKSADEAFVANKAKAAEYTRFFTEALKQQEAAVKANAETEAKANQEFAARQRGHQDAAKQRTIEAERSMAAANQVKNNRLADIEAAFADDRANSFQKRALEAQDRISVTRAQASYAAASTASPTLSGQVSGILGASGSQAISDTAAQVDALGASIKRGSLSTEAYAEAMRKVATAQKQLESQAALIDNFRRTSEATAIAKTEFDNAAREVNRLAEELKKAGPDAENLAAELTRAEAAMARQGQVLERQVVAQTKADAAMKAAKIDTGQLATEQIKLIETSEKLAQVEARIGEKGGDDGTIFGLKPYQFQNVQYRIEDFITQMSLGQSALQAFESQGLKTFHTFALSAEDIGKLIVALGAFSATIGVLALGLKQLYDQTETIRQFNAQVDATADAGARNATALFDQAKTIQHYGASFKEATEAVQEFVRAGIANDRIAEFGRVAQDVADVWGKSFPDAVKEVTSGFTGNYEAIRKLDEQYNFLTATQAATIREMIETGHAAEAQAMAFDIFKGKLHSVEHEGISPLTKAMRELKATWDEVMTALANSKGLTNLIDNLNVLLHLGMVLTGKMSGTDFSTYMAAGQGNSPSPEDYQLGRLKAERDELQTRLNGPGEGSVALGLNEVAPIGGGAPANAQERADMQTRLRELDAKIADLQKQMAPTAVNPGVSQDFAKMRDAVAKQVGLDPEALARVQNVEGVMGPDGKWQTSSAGATGPMQLLPSTFDDMKKKYADVTGDINDVFSNLVAGAHYLKEQLQSRGNLQDAYGAYHDGPGYARGGDGRRDRSGAAQQAINVTRAGASIADYQGSGLKDTPQSFENNKLLQQGTDALTKSSQDFTHQLDLEIDAMRDRTLTGKAGQAQIERELDTYKADLEERAAAAHAYGPAAQAKIEEDVAARRTVLQDQLEKRDKALAERQIALQQAVANAAKEAADKAAEYDKTNAAAARKAVDDTFDKYEEAIQKAQRAGLSGVGGTSFDQVRQQLDAAKQLQEIEVSIKADEAAVNDLLKQRKAATDGIMDSLKKGAISASEAWKQLQAALASAAPGIRAAAQRGIGDLSKLPSTPQTSGAISKLTGDADGASVPSAQEGEQILTAGFKQLTDLQSIRTNATKEQQELVNQGAENQRTADANVQAVYNQTHDMAEKTIADLTSLIDQMKATGAINEETWSKYHEQLVKAQGDTVFLSETQKELLKTIENDVVKGVTSAFDSVAKSIAGAIDHTNKWRDVLPSLAASFETMTASILKDIANIILKQQLMSALQTSGLGKFLGIASGGGGGGGSGIAGTDNGDGTFTASNGQIYDASTGVINNDGTFSQGDGSGGAASALGFFGKIGSLFSSLFHEGGIVGSGNGMTRSVDASLFNYARRYHTGGSVGLANDEVPAVLQRGEEVLSKSDPRNALNSNSSKNPGGGTSIRNVLAVGDREIASAMAGTHGETTVLNHIKRNANTIRSWVGQ